MAEHQGEQCEIDIRRDVVMDLYLKGHTQREIAKQLGIGLATVCSDIAAVREEWRLERVELYEEHRDIRARQILRVMVAAWDGFERSRKDAETVKVSVVKGRATKEGASLGDLTKSEKSTTGQVGNPKFLELYFRCVERLCHLYGLDSPKRTEITGANGGPIGIAAVLHAIGLAPPSKPVIVETEQPNVFDVEAVLAEIEGPDSGESTNNNDESQELTHNPIDGFNPGNSGVEQ